VWRGRGRDSVAADNPELGPTQLRLQDRRLPLPGVGFAAVEEDADARDLAAGEVVDVRRRDARRGASSTRLMWDWETEHGRPPTHDEWIRANDSAPRAQTIEAVSGRGTRAPRGKPRSAGDRGA
jgi:hypothetical protein